MALVDTDVMVDVLRNYPPALEWMRAQAAEALVMPGFVLLELIEGCRDKESQERVLRLAGGCDVAWLSDDGANSALHLFAEHRLANGLDMIDALVGQTALELGVPLLTFNQKHYACIPGLMVEAPYGREV